MIPATSRRSLLLVLLLAGCDPLEAGDSPDLDAGPDLPDIEPALEVGTGAVAFVPFADGDTLALVRGAQGLQHVWIALRTWGIEPRGTLLSLALVRDRDRKAVSELHVRVSLTPVEGELYSEIDGLTLVIADPEAALDEPLTLRAGVTEAGDGEATVTSERHLRVAWGPEDP